MFILKIMTIRNFLRDGVSFDGIWAKAMKAMKAAKAAAPAGPLPKRPRSGTDGSKLD